MTSVAQTKHDIYESVFIDADIHKVLWALGSHMAISTNRFAFHGSSTELVFDLLHLP